MRAITFHRYGEPSAVMQLTNTQEVPRPNSGQVLVKVQCCSVNAADRYIVRANYLIVRLLVGLFRPARKNKILGMDIAGTVHDVGERVRGFKAGDAVAADIRKSLGGGFAEYAIVSAEDLVRIPDAVSFEQAATVPISGQAAMMGIILCEIKTGDRVLVRGASGGVGSFAIKIAKALGARVTAMCSAAKADAVKEWGADEIVDYEAAAIQNLAPNSFDAVFDAASFGSPGAFAEVLEDEGVYVLVGGDYYNMLRVKLFGRWYARGNQRYKAMSQDVEVSENIASVFNMISRGEVEPYIQKTIALSEVPGAISSLERREVIGKIVVNNQK